MEFEECLKKYSFEQQDIGNLNDVLDTNYFVISIPKCGTTSITDGLRKIGHKVIHAHVNCNTYHNMKHGFVLRDHNWGLEHFVWRRLKKSNKITMFSGFRDPISWYLSLYFHHTSNIIPSLQENFYNNLYNEYPWSYYSFGEHFNLIKTCTGIDILEHDFDKENGILVIENDMVKLVLYRLDKIVNLEKYISTNVPGFSLTRGRINKHDIYKNYVNNFRINQSDVSNLKKDPYVRFFFGDGFDSIIASFLK